MNAKTNEYRVDIASEWRNVLKTPANLHLLSTQLSVLCAMAEADATARAEAAEADARECRAERARYGDAMTARLAGVEAERDAFAFELSKSLLESQRRLEQKQDAEAERDRAVIERNYANTLKDAAVEQLAIARQERDALRERCIDWLPFTEAAQDIGGSILVWREDAGTFVAFYDGEQECWFTSFGEDLTGDLPAFYAKMPKGPDNKRPALQKDGLSDNKG